MWHEAFFRHNPDRPFNQVAFSWKHQHIMLPHNPVHKALCFVHCMMTMGSSCTIACTFPVDSCAIHYCHPTKKHIGQLNMTVLPRSGWWAYRAHRTKMCHTFMLMHLSERRHRPGSAWYLRTKSTCTLAGKTRRTSI